MGRAILIIAAGALAVGVIIYALIECAQSDRYRVRAIPKGAWLLVILLLPVVGALLWLFFGRPRQDDAARVPERGRGPDDDPQFLRNLEERRKQQEQARRLQERENELKRTGRAPGVRPGTDDAEDGTSAPDADSRGTNFRGTDSQGTDSQGTDSQGTDSRGTDPRESQPRRENPGDEGPTENHPAAEDTDPRS